MSRYSELKSSKYRNITFLCRECGGDLRPLREHAAVSSEWVCELCSRVWVYGETGWELVR